MIIALTELSKNLVKANAHPDVKELVSLLVNQSAFLIIKENNHRKALKKLRRLQTVLEMANRQVDAHSVISIMDRISLLFSKRV